MANVDHEEIATYDGNLWALEQAIRSVLLVLPIVQTDEIYNDIRERLESYITATQPNSSEEFRRAAADTLQRIFDGLPSKKS